MCEADLRGVLPEPPGTKAMKSLLHNNDHDRGKEPQHSLGLKQRPGLEQRIRTYSPSHNLRPGSREGLEIELITNGQ